MRFSERYDDVETVPSSSAVVRHHPSSKLSKQKKNPTTRTFGSMVLSSNEQESDSTMAGGELKSPTLSYSTTTAT
jgi:hypothetical protein